MQDPDSRSPDSGNAHGRQAARLSQRPRPERRLEREGGGGQAPGPPPPHPPRSRLPHGPQASLGPPATERTKREAPTAACAEDAGGGPDASRLSDGPRGGRSHLALKQSGLSASRPSSPFPGPGAPRAQAPAPGTTPASRWRSPCRRPPPPSPRASPARPRRHVKAGVLPPRDLRAPRERGGAGRTPAARATHLLAGAGLALGRPPEEGGPGGEEEVFGVLLQAAVAAAHAAGPGARGGRRRPGWGAAPARPARFPARRPDRRPAVLLQLRPPLTRPARPSPAPRLLASPPGSRLRGPRAPRPAPPRPSPALPGPPLCSPRARPQVGAALPR